MTIEQLKNFGCNVEEGLNRCMNNESFYIMLVNKFLTTTDLSKLENALKENDLENAFNEVHSLKGVCGNLSLTPLFNIANEMVEPLRKRTEMNYSSLFDELTKLFNQLKNL